jgi:hypothetical protein
LQGRPAQVKASKEGYEPAMEDFQLEDREYAVDFTIYNRPESLDVLIIQLDGRPLEGADVLFTLGGKSVLGQASTGGDGLVSFTVPAHRLDQQALLKVHKDGWYKVERLVLLRRDQPQVQITLEPSATEAVPMSGRILDQGGKALAGARVLLELPGHAATQLVTDADGRWSLVLAADLYGGEGLLHAEHPDFHPARDVKLPLMPNAMHVVPMMPLRAPSGGRTRWLVAALVLAVLAAAAAMLLRS